MFDTATLHAQGCALSAGKAGRGKPACVALFGVNPDMLAATGADAVWFRSQYGSV
ncbi:hypothetical protein [Xanthomonas translucens]|uniref:hypothetical protein n=1 Tax=Xanthomonas campestris pv. translucens TaxID=343 RepID=UPI00147A235E|nr:hypothetical protein [Xanthomonas translucens]MBC3972636.1 hypothetical protein [Xanthomonas translucens pv. undulosa]MCT8271669.1 hypothetical protein [Xanthomonas translucens pv. undulosa]MCT8281696.1 hypothetical protein [Xanthomonas translucens pv. undulosa]MCT8316387.1 hypothetical protein [Xanthomonas translucens pv. undulosa]QSQ42415.1 hypothetical protein ISN33_04215 [Xanthomonas translucens pv. translucens]